MILSVIATYTQTDNYSKINDVFKPMYAKRGFIHKSAQMSTLIVLEGCYK